MLFGFAPRGSREVEILIVGPNQIEVTNVFLPLLMWITIPFTFGNLFSASAIHQFSREKSSARHDRGIERTLHIFHSCPARSNSRATQDSVILTFAAERHLSHRRWSGPR